MPRDRGVGTGNRVCETDPVDVATGDVVMVQTDLTVSGAPMLELVRTHISSYRAGGWFGLSWASTVDFRLEVDDTDVCCLTPDGMILVYPMPAGGGQVLPVEGPRWPLRREDGGFVVTAAGQEISFAPIAGRSSAVLPVRTVSDGLGGGFTFEYDAAGAPTAVRHTDGYLVSVGTEGGRVTTLDMVDPASGTRVPVSRFSYDADGRLATVSNSSGLGQRFDYDADGRLLGWQDRTGTWYRYIYDADGRCVRTVGDGGFYDGEFSYDRERLVTRFSDSLGAVTEYQLNDANQTLRRVDPAGGVTGYEWDRYDALLSRTDPLGAVTRYRYTEDGALAGVTRPDGSEVLVSSAPGRLSIAVTEGGRMYDRTYAGDRVPDPFAEQLGVASGFSYEDLQKPNPFTDVEPGEEAGAARRDERDLFGRLRTITDEMGGRTQLSWTVEGLRSQRIDPLGAREQWGYDAEGHAVTHTGTDGAVTRREYGPFGLVTATTDALGGRTSYRYDTELRLVEVAGAHGASWRYTYDGVGRLVEETDYDGRTLKFSYDAAGRVVRSVNGVGEATEFRYDVLGNLTERRTDAGSTTYSYDPVGRLIAAATAGSTLEIRRDERGRVVHEAADRRGVTYAGDDAAVRRRTPSGVDSSWVFDAYGRPRRLEIAGRTVEFEHDADGRETMRRFGETTVTQTFDPARRLTSQTIVSGSTAAVVQRRQFRYRGDGRLTEVHDALAGVSRYELDTLGRVNEVVTPDQVESYRYDAVGNITHSAENGTGLHRVSPELGQRRYSGNQLVLAGSVGYGYDRQGRLVMRRVDGGVWHYHWDSGDRLTAVTLPDGSGWQYRYDPLGRRISKEHVAGGRVLERIEFTWRGAVLVEQARADAAGAQVTTWEYHPVDGRPVVQLDHGAHGVRFAVVVTDIADRPAELVDETGAVVWKSSASLWGRTADTTVPLGFPGQYADAETGLHYNVYRYYDPSTARYVSQDPLGLGPAVNPVGYALNPLHEADPLGLACTDAPSTASVPDRPGSGGSDAAHLTDDAPSSGGRPTDNPDFGSLNDHNVAGGSTEHTIKLPDGSEHKIVSTPMTKLEGYHGIKPEHYDTVVNEGGVARPSGGTAGNANPDWKGWYLGENHEDVAPFSWSGEKPGAILKYETPGPVTVHDVPHQLTAEVDGGINPVTMSALKQHFGIGEGESLMDGLAGKGGVIRTTDGEDGMSEFIVPWDKAAGGKVSVEGYVNMMNDIKPRPTRDNGLFGQI
ncbi:RHS repeat-associated core domain-containing protein [Amycolatopsis sp.]|uniref:RHS repeat-associated core domain-containing protein n=1 Tax=Amycolatopsis sp. TaxID=37632 RepID=UPI00263118C7|nr:RHS repeat-associated core domain-containing protein [Amycolatopsis sp.]